MDPFIVDDDEASTFTRSQNFEEPSSIGIFLFVCMVMVCVFTFAGMSPGTDGSRRDLLQLYEVSDSLINEPILKTIVEDTVSFEEEKLNYHLANNPKDFSRTKEILIEKVRSEYP